jgi:hypothetical protein
MRITFVASDDLISAVPYALKALEKAWPDCPYPIDVAYNAVAPEVDGLRYTRLIKRPNPNYDWVGNMIYYIRNYNMIDPFLLLLEDYLVCHLVADRIALTADIIAKPDVGMVRIVPTPGPTLPYSDSIGQFDLKEPYATSLQASWWKPSTMLTICEALVARERCTAWDFELEGSRIASALDLPLFLGLWRGQEGMAYQNLYLRGKRFAPAEEWIRKNLP